MNDNSIDSKLADIEKRLSVIEHRLQITIPKPNVSPVTTPEVKKSEASSGNLLGIVAIICFVLAAAFIVKLSIQSGWLTPVRQIGIAYLLGVTLIGVGFRYLAADKKYLSLLPAAGVIILYLTTFAAKQLYFLIPFETSIIITSIISLLTLWFYFKIKHDVYAIVAAIGAYVSPVFLGAASEHLFSLYYFVICSMTFAIMSIYTHSRTLSVIAAYLAIFLTALIGLSIAQDRLIVLLLAGHFLIFSIGIYTYSIYTGTRLTEKEAWSYFPILLVFYAAEYHYLYNINVHYAPWISLLFAGFLFLLYLAGKARFKHSASEQVVFGFLAIVLFHSGYLELLPDAGKPWLFSAIVVCLALMPKHINFYNTAKKNIQIIPTLVIAIVLAIEYGRMLLHFEIYDLNLFLATLAASASIWLLFIKRMGSYIIICAAHILAITALYEFTHDISSLAVSVAWLVYGGMVIIAGFMRKDKMMANSALIVLGVATLKVFLLDVAAAPTIIRILCLLVTGAVLYGSGFLMRKISKWD